MKTADRSKVVKYGRHGWTDIPVRRYKDDPNSRYRDVTRRTLMGEGDDETALAFVTRYFEVAPGGYSTLERHAHAHAVVIVRGRGTVVLDEREYPVAPFDCVYVAPATLHQFQAGNAEPLGFLCVVNRERDRPTLPAPEEVARLVAMGVPAKPFSEDDG